MRQTPGTIAAVIASSCVLAGVGITQAASAEQGGPFHIVAHPVDTFSPDLPARCDVLRKMRAEQHSTIDGRKMVREVLIFRLDCPKRERTMVRRGPWLNWGIPGPASDGSVDGQPEPTKP